MIIYGIVSVMFYICGKELDANDPYKHFNDDSDPKHQLFTENDVMYDNGNDNDDNDSMFFDSD